MRMNRWLMAGVGMGIAAVSFQKNRSCRNRSGEEHFNERDATLLGLKAHQTEVGGSNASHVKEGIGRIVQPKSPAV
jgi:hypothetical protein